MNLQIACPAELLRRVKSHVKNVPEMTQSRFVREAIREKLDREKKPAEDVE